MEMIKEKTESSCLHDMQKDGIAIFRNWIDAEKIRLMINEIAKIKALVMTKIKDMDRPLQTYSDIAERHLNRLDYRCGFTAEVFESVAKPIASVINRLSPTITFRHYWGA